MQGYRITCLFPGYFKSGGSMKKIIVAVAFILLVLPSLAYCTGLAGSYKCIGKNPNGSTYEGIVKIAPKGKAYTVEWTIGNDVHTGFGILVEGVLSVSLTNGVGVAEYKVKKDGKLVGNWAMPGEDSTINSETMTPLK